MHTARTKEYIELAGSDHLRKFGQYFTPPEVANFMVQWVTSANELNILDPAIGNSIFSKTALLLGKDVKFVGYEIDPLIVESFPSPDNTEIYLEDFLLSSWKEKYDSIIANPPYLKFQYISNREKIQKSFENNSEVVPNRLANSYIWFIIKCIQQLRPNGRMAFLVPPDFFDSVTGRVVREYLLKTQSLESVVSLDNLKDPIFPGVLTNACILLISNRLNKSFSVFIPDSLEDLQFSKYLRQSTDNMVVDYSSLTSYQTWGFLIRGGAYREFSNQRLSNLAEFCNVRRGLATGANKYFLMDFNKINTLQLSKGEYIKVIPRSLPIIKGAFTGKLFNELADSGQSVYLFCPGKIVSEGAKRYIEEGVQQGISKLSLPASRKPWYSRENVRSAPILVGQASRGKVKVVRNFETDVVHLTAFHGIYPLGCWEKYTNAIYAILKSEYGQLLLKESAKIMANGLMKFQPRDLQKSKFINISSLGDDLDNLNILGYNLALQDDKEQQIIDKINLIIKKHI